MTAAGRQRARSDDLAAAARIMAALADAVDAADGWADARHVDVRGLAEEFEESAGGPSDVDDRAIAAALLDAARRETGPQIAQDGSGDPGTPPDGPQPAHGAVRPARDATPRTLTDDARLAALAKVAQAARAATRPGQTAQEAVQTWTALCAVLDALPPVDEPAPAVAQGREARQLEAIADAATAVLDVIYDYGEIARGADSEEKLRALVYGLEDIRRLRRTDPPPPPAAAHDEPGEPDLEECGECGWQVEPESDDDDPEWRCPACGAGMLPPSALAPEAGTTSGGQACVHCGEPIRQLDQTRCPGCEDPWDGD